METQQERRRHKRLPLKTAVFCQKVGATEGKMYSGSTLNVSGSGLLMEVNGQGPFDGVLLSVDMAVPAATGLWDCDGTLSSYARVVRVDGPESCQAAGARRVALEFCGSPKIRV